MATTISPPFYALGDRLYARSPVTSRVVSFECSRRESAQFMARLLQRTGAELAQRPDLTVEVVAAEGDVIVCIAEGLTVRLRPLTCTPLSAVGLLTHCLHAGIHADADAQRRRESDDDAFSPSNRLASSAGHFGAHRPGTGRHTAPRSVSHRRK